MSENNEPRTVPGRPQPRQRLASLKDPRVTRKARAAKIPPRPRCPTCRGSNVVEVDGNTVCEDCGTSISESNIVAEVTFGESSTGAAVIQGGFVGEGQRHARSLGQAFRRAGGLESREVAENFGRDEIRRLANRLHLSENISDQAFAIYKLAANANFIQGRRVTVVAAACLYIACRRDPHNQTLLMDFSEIITVNVFKLGQTYNDLKKTLWLETEAESGIKPVIEVENLIMKFARKLEFGNAVMKVAEDAAKIIKRMKRDWMVTGRRPAGLCGACIILAARMNNFRRTVREVVYVVKVGDMTVAKRIEEFKQTQSGNLTVDQFREYGVRLKKQHDPPAVRAKSGRKNKKRKLSADATSDNNASGSVRDEPQQPIDGSSAQEPRHDADGFAIPNLPTQRDNEGEGEVESETPDTNGKRKPGKPKGRKNNPKIPIPEITEEDLIGEDELEREIDSIISDPAAMLNMDDSAFAEIEERAQALSVTLQSNTVPRGAVSMDPIIDEAEFEDDPEVENCLLSEEEQKIKERIWVTLNEDWLRAQQAKLLRKALEEATGADKKPKKKRRRGRLGDGSVLEGGEPVDSAAAANARMLERRGKGFSKHIDYSALQSYYTNDMKSGRKAAAESETTSEAGTEVSSVILDQGESTPARTSDDGDGRAGQRSNQNLQSRRSTGTGTAGASEPQEAAEPAREDENDDYEDDEVDDEDEDDFDSDDEEAGNEEGRRVMDQFGIEAGDFDEDEDAGFGFDEEDE